MIFVNGLRDELSEDRDKIAKYLWRALLCAFVN